MNHQLIATLFGIVFQLVGAGYLVWRARFTANKFSGYKGNITYDNFATVIDDLAHEIHGQFGLQARGFILIAVGAALQFYGAVPF